MTTFATPRRLLALLALLICAIAALAPVAQAATTVTRTVTSTSTYIDPNAPVLVTSQTTPPVGFRLNAAEVERIAAASPVMVAELHRHPGALPYEYTKGPGQWQVSWFFDNKEIAQVYVDDATGKVTEAWTGFQVAWTMARGYPGAFGHNLNHPWVFIPLCVLFVAPFLPWGRRRGGRRGWSLLQLDLVMLLGFSISFAFFNNANLGLSVPLAYPFLLYFLVRMLLLAWRRGRAREAFRLRVPAWLLVVGLLALVGFRSWQNISNSGVIDVGYAGVIGADRLIHGQPLYGVWPADNPTGDTYGPVNYYAYLPFRLLFGWSGAWDSLPAGHAAAIAFDLLTILGLFLLGWRRRGPTMGLVLAYAWAAYPFTFYVLQSNSNDALLALLLVATLLLLDSPVGRGITGSLAAFAKLFPFILGPLLLRGAGPWPPRRKSIAFVVAYALTGVVVMLPVLLNGGLHTFWEHTFVRQFDRTAPFSIWGLWGGLNVEQHLVQVAAGLLAIAVAFVPERRGLVEVSALAAAVIIAFQVGLTYWFYLYIVWFFPLVIVALFCQASSPVAEALELEMLSVTRQAQAVASR